MITTYAVVDYRNATLNVRVNKEKAIDCLRHFREQGKVCKLIYETTIGHKSTEETIIDYDHPIPGEPTIVRQFTTRQDEFTAPGRIVLRQFANGGFAVHWHNQQDGGFYHGQYPADEGKAHAAFERRVAEWIAAYGITA